MTAFGQELAGTLRRASVVDALVRRVQECLTPSEIALALFDPEGEGRDYFAGLADRGRPTGVPCSISRVGGVPFCFRPDSGPS